LLTRFVAGVFFVALSADAGFTAAFFFGVETVVVVAAFFFGVEVGAAAATFLAGAAVAAETLRTGMTSDADRTAAV